MRNRRIEKKWRKAIKRWGTLCMILALLLSFFPGSQLIEAGVVYAADGDGIGTGATAGNPPVSDPNVGPVIIGDGDGGTGDSGYSITVNSTNVSFGTVSQGDVVNAQAITIRNTGMVDVELSWNESDPEHVFDIDAPANLILPVNGSTTFYVKPDTTAAGSYTGILLIGADTDPCYVNGVQVALSVTVNEPQPYVSSVQINPGMMSMVRGSAYQFSATVTGGNNPSAAVNWSVGGNTSGSTGVSSNGVLNIGADENTANLSLTAASAQDPSVYATANITVTKADHNVAIQANPGAGGTVSGGGTVNDGGSVSVYAAANNGYSFTGWSINGQQVSQANSYTINNITGDLTAIANFTQNSVTVTLDTKNSNGGRVTGGGRIAVGGSMSISADPNNGYVFGGWQENGTIISKDKNLQLNNITTDRKLTAVFNQNCHQVKLMVNPQDTGTVSGGGTYNAGTDVKVKAEAYQGYQFVGWSLNGNYVSTSAEYVISKLSQDVCLTANYTKQQVTTYTISADVAAGKGEISPAGKSTITKGNTITYVITPANGYQVTGVLVDKTQVGAVNTYTFTNLNGNHTIHASFGLKPQAAPAQTQPTNKAPDTAKASATKVPATTTPDNENTTGTATIQDTTATGEQDQNTDIDYSEEVNGTTESGIESGTEDLDTMTGVLQVLNITRSEALQRIKEGNNVDLEREARTEGYLQISVNSDFADSSQESADGSFYSSPSLPNFKEVYQSLMTEDELLDMYAGSQVGMNVSITDYSQFISDKDKELIDAVSKDGLVVGNYFDIVFMKTTYGNSELITQLDVPMQVVMNIPESMKGHDVYAVVRIHDTDGKIERNVLKDLDENPDTITFETDKFSAFAIVYEDGTSQVAAHPIMTIILIILVCVVIALMIVLMVFTLNHKGRRRNIHTK